MYNNKGKETIHFPFMELIHSRFNGCKQLFFEYQISSAAVPTLIQHFRPRTPKIPPLKTPHSQNATLNSPPNFPTIHYDLFPVGN